MYKVEITDLGKDKKEMCEIISHITYKDLYNLVKPYVKETHLSFSIPNDYPDGHSWSYIYAGEKHVGKIKITFMDE